jgi:hypothetical protein
MVHPEKPASNAMYKDYDKDDMLKIDEEMLVDGQMMRDDDMSLNSIVEETKEPMMGDNMNTNSGINDPAIWSDDNMRKSDD